MFVKIAWKNFDGQRRLGHSTLHETIILKIKYLLTLDRM